ncbi:MAG: YdgA family protein [Enterobacteriaceae bacterium]|jgi:uncharacterized protein YdgA (DUF945 family)|nr:YdgA family protein [Enterobacteriaceae bacterium]
MKKSVVAVGVLAVLGGAWVGGAWYTGKMIQTRIEDGVIAAQSYLDQNTPEYAAKIKIANYQRSLFSSQVTYTATAGEHTISIGQKISHGPFPLDHFSLMPKLAFSTVEFVKQPLLNELFTMTGGKSPVTAETLIGYNGDSTMKLVVEPMQRQTDNNFKFSGLTLDGVGEKNQSISLTSSPLELTSDDVQLMYDTVKIDITQTKNKEYSVNGNLGKLTIIEKNIDDENLQAIFNGFSLKSQIKEGKFGNTGTSDVALQNISYTVNNKPVLAFDNLTIANNVQEDDKFVNQTIDTNISQISVEDKKLGSAALKINFNQFDGQALQFLNKNVNQLTLLMLSDNKSENTDQIMSNVMTLLDGNPTISISPFSWKNDKGESQIDLSATMMRPASLNARSISQLIFSAVKQFSSDAKLSVPMMTEVIRVLPSGLSDQEAQDKAAKVVQSWIKIGIDQGILNQQDENTVTYQFNYTDGTVDLNGQKLPAEQFFRDF